MIDYMSLVHDLIVNMNGWFAVCIVGFFGIFVIGIITSSINKNSRAVDAYNAQKLEYAHEIAKLVEQRKLIDLRSIEGSARRIAQDTGKEDWLERERNNG